VVTQRLRALRILSQGWETLCHEQQNSGYSVNGSFAEYALADADYLGRIPKELSFADAGPILCAGVTTYKGLKETEARPGEWVCDFWRRRFGAHAIQYAKAMGFHVAAVDVGDDKLSLATKLGADLTVNAKSEDAAAMIQKHVGGAHGVLVTAVFADRLQTSARDAASSWHLRAARTAAG
jgi:propanol-preferring alcohol dehydrogenase